MKSFWVKYGQVEARSMVEARRAEVGFFFVVYGFSFKLSVACSLFLHLYIIFARVIEDGGCVWYY